MYPEGSDAEWFGVDASGYIARFTTGGLGPVPKNVIDAELPWFYETNELKQCCGAEMLRKLPRPDDFLELSKRGIYGFDWSDVHRSKTEYTNHYELISKPITPILFDEIHHFFAEYPPVVKFENILFENSGHIELVGDLVWISQ